MKNLETYMEMRLLFDYYIPIFTLTFFTLMFICVGIYSTLEEKLKRFFRKRKERL